MTAGLSQLAVGFRVRGIATQDCSAGSVWYRSGVDVSDLPSGYIWEDRLVEIPPSMPAGTDLRTGDVQTNDFRIALHNREDVATSFEVSASRSIGKTENDIKINEGTVETNVTGYADTTVYVGTETMYLNEETSSGVYDVARERRGSKQTRHAAGARIYTNPPYWRGRLVDLVYWRDDLDGEQIRWTGYIRDISENENGTVLVLDTGHILERMEAIRVGRDRSPVTYNNEVFGGATEIASNEFWPVGGTRPRQYQTQVRKERDWDRPWPMAVDADGGFHLVDYEQSGPQVALFGSSNDVDHITYEPIDAEEHEIWELLVFGEQIADKAASQGVGNPVATKNVYSDPHHIVRIVLAFLVSDPFPSEAGNNVLDGRFGLNLDEFCDTIDISDLVDRHPSRTVDHWIFGWGGEPVDIWSRLSRALRGWGYFWAVAQDGKLTVASFEAPGIEEADDRLGKKLTVIQRLDEPLLQREQSHATEVDRITAKIGRWPWADPKEIAIQETGTPGRASTLAPAEEVTFDLGTVSLDNETKVRSQLRNRLRKHHQTMPRLTVRVHDPSLPGESGPDLDIGQIVALDDLGLVPGTEHMVDADGNRVEFDGGSLQWLGVIQARKHEIDRGTYVLDLLLVSHGFGTVVRQRGPSMQITADNSGGDDDKVYCASESQFGFGDPDNTSLRVGHRIQVVDRQGVTLGGPYTVADIDSDSNGDYLQIQGTFGLGGAVDDFVRLSPYDDYEANQTANDLDILSVRWTYLADLAEELGPDPDTAHIYGV